jgi:hypothetical protein
VAFDVPERLADRSHAEPHEHEPPNLRLARWARLIGIAHISFDTLGMQAGAAGNRDNLARKSSLRLFRAA